MLESHMQFIPGKDIADQIYAELKPLIQQASSAPSLHVILATDDPAAHSYVQMKTRQAEQLGVTVELHEYSDTTAADTLIKDITEICTSDPAAGILVQLPLYPALEKSRGQILDAISPELDVDGLTAASAGALARHGNELWSALKSAHNVELGFLPATVAAVMECLTYTQIDLQGAEVCIVNSSDLIGKPLAMLLTSMNATVTLCHEFTRDLAVHTSNADILITATGRPGLITADMVKQNAVVIDITSLRTESGVKGDVVVTPELEAKVAWLTPVPGGVGPLTIASLLRNVVCRNPQH